MSTFLLNVPPNRNFGDATGLERNSCMKFCPMSPPPEPGAAPEHIYNLVDVIVSNVYNRVVQTVGPGPKFGPLTDFFWAL